MKYIIAVFRTRYATLNFANLLKSFNIPVAIINTPQDLGRVCGLSVKFLSIYFSKVQSLTDGCMTNFQGYYTFSQQTGRFVKV